MAAVGTSVFLKCVPNGRHHEQIFVRQSIKRLGQYSCLLIQTDIFIDNAVHLSFDQANPAFYGDSTGAKALLRDGYTQFFR